MTVRRICGIAAIAVALLPHALAAEEPAYRVVEGLAVYLGVVPAEIVRGHPKAHPERTMHGPAPRDEHAYHLVVAVFDAAMGRRLEDLAVKATLLAPARPPATAPLEKMTVAGTVTYGNFFRLAGYGTFRFRIVIDRPGETRPAVAEFAYEHRLR